MNNKLINRDDPLFSISRVNIVTISNVTISDNIINNLLFYRGVDVDSTIISNIFINNNKFEICEKDYYS
jgi:hypothetical protein